MWVSGRERKDLVRERRGACWSQDWQDGWLLFLIQQVLFLIEDRYMNANEAHEVTCTRSRTRASAITRRPPARGVVLLSSAHLRIIMGKFNICII